ncbi:MAG: acyl-CoA thioesterase [Thermus aquaticus]|uniref:acyl-CoA thioesterase n=1 Tax=Thermus TaxID=270 RepID=UPI0028CC3379|nr:thioesterase family protein [Thermus sp.]MDT7910436.1 thioesterase family protein [Thermus sp.]MDT7923081.1 thioesterase family protein [Thermus sp.]
MEGFPVVVPIQVRFRDLDALGHVNNAVYLTYLEVARAAYFSRLEPDWVGKGHFILARAEVDFLRPILLQDPVEVGVRVVRLGRSSFDMEYLVLAAGEEAARGKTVQVWLEGGRPAPLPQEVRARIAELEGRPL